MIGKRGEIKNRITRKVKGVKAQVKKEVQEEILFNVPNTITLLRLVFAFVFIYMLFSDFSKISLTVVFAIAAISDWFDGFAARRLKQTTAAGARMDQVIDRVFTAMIVLALFIFYYKTPGNGNIILLLFFTISREIVGLPGLLIALIKNKDPYKVKYIGKATTFIQGFALGAIILGVPWAIYIVIPTFIIGILSGFNYLKYSFD